MSDSQATQPTAAPLRRLPAIIFAAASGTFIEWYDFFIFGSLTSVLAVKFYPPGNDTFALIAYLATFAVGFVVRPFGALFFGRIGDHMGRRIAFILTLTVMGFSTAAIGLLPTYATAGWIAPSLLIAIRVLQGLALGGEYGGAAVFVAEHVADKHRGFFTSFIQLTSSFGFVLSLAVIMITQSSVSAAAFQSWGWRLPFLLSIILVAMSLIVRFRMKESPIFNHMKAKGLRASNPLREAFANWENLRTVLISLFGATAGQGVVWYTGSFYALFFLQNLLHVPAAEAYRITAVATVAGIPLYIVFGALSDRVGRKRVMMTALVLAIFTDMPIYHAMQNAAGNNVVTVSSVKDPVTGAIKLTPLTRAADGRLTPAPPADHANAPLLVLLVWVQVAYACMIYGPIAAYLVEAFPARVRYTSLSLPYHVGNGVFGGLLPLVGLSLCASTGNIYAGLYYPIAIASVGLVVGLLLLKETRHTQIWNELGPAEGDTGPQPLS